MEPFDEAMWYPTVLEFVEEYVMIHYEEALYQTYALLPLPLLCLGKIDKQGADRATLIHGTAPGVEDRD